MALGQMEAGRYLTALFIHKKTKEALILSARDMAQKERKSMAENNPQKLSSFASLDELVEFFDANDLGDYLGQMPEAYFEVDVQRRTHLVALDGELSDKLSQIARRKKVPVEALVNAWLREKISGGVE